jgi:DNA-binding CsgD family transcriptional regulator
MVDWSAVAMLLAERSEMPAVLLNGQGKVLLVAPAAERALGWKYDSVGANWVERHVVPASAAAADWFFDKTLSGALRSFEVEVHTSDGDALASFESYAVGQPDSRGVLLLLQTVVPSSHKRPSSDYDYEVQGVATQSFELGSLWRIGSGPVGGGGKCYQLIHGRDRPCEICPLREPSAPRTLVRPLSGDEYELSTATLDGDTARISVRRLPLATFTALLEARLNELCVTARLSARESDVLRQLVDGRSLDEIANALGIGRRTVKFHQANLLQKLGADSRSDLMRLVF